MTNINSFFTSKNTVNKLSEKEEQQVNDYIEAVKAFSRTTYSSLYVIDYEKKGFDYVSENPLFLCGHTPDEVKEMGYEFYFKYVPQEDLDLLLTINTVGFDFYETIPVEDRKIHTISYDFLLKTKEGKPILINQKLTPMFLTDEGKVWKALCVVSLSTKPKSGNIIVFKNGSDTTFEYDLKGRYWKSLEKIKLTDREIEILQYSVRGYTIKEIAEKIFVSSDTVKFHRKKLFEKLNVANISEAITYVTNNKLI